MSEQPKPLSAEDVEWVRHQVMYGGGGPGWPQTQKVLRSLLASLDAERARADAAERRVQKLKRAMEHVIEHASEITSDHHRDDCPVDDGCESCRLGDIVNDAMSDGGIVAAEKSCEDWQECASHLALAIRGRFIGRFITPSDSTEIREALAEFDRLASEATKGVEF